MKLQQVIDKVASEVAAIKTQAEANLEYCRGAQDTLARIVDILNNPVTEPVAEKADEQQQPQ